MKIAIIHFGRKGAGPTISLEMARALCRQGHTIFYYASSEAENRQYVEKEPFEKRLFKTYDTKLDYIKSVIFNTNIRKVIKSINQDAPDVVYSTMNDMWLPFVFPKLKKYLRIKTIHDVGVHEGNDSIVNKWWNNSNFKDAEKFIILSKKYVDRLVERGIDRKNIVVIPHAGFDIYAKIGGSQASATTGMNLLFFGRIDQYKGINVLLDAMPKVIEQYPNVRLSIVGNGDMSSYKSKVEDLKRNVLLHNRWIKDEEVAGFVSSADVVILPYTHATQSGVIPLAYAFSKPVVASNVGCLDEQVIDGKTGYLIKGNDAEALSDAIIKMISDQNRMKLMGEYAHQYMLENLTWDASAKLLINFLTNHE